MGRVRDPWPMPSVVVCKPRSTRGVVAQSSEHLIGWAWDFEGITRPTNEIPAQPISTCSTMHEHGQKGSWPGVCLGQSARVQPDNAHGASAPPITSMCVGKARSASPRAWLDQQCGLCHMVSWHSLVHVCPRGLKCLSNMCVLSWHLFRD